MNIQKIFKEDENKSELKVLDGVRVFSLGWIIVTYAYAFILFIPINNVFTADELFQAPLFGIVPGGFYAIDIFLFTSGLMSFYVLA